MALHTGKRPFIPDENDIKLRAVLKDAPQALAAPPERFGYGLAYSNWGMLGNGPDETVAPGFAGCGDCFWAGAAHDTKLWSHTVGIETPFTGAVVVEAYSAGTGYDLSQTDASGNNPTDQGTDVRAGLKFRQQTGITDANGVVHKIGAYIALTPGDVQEFLTAAFWFEAVGVGIEFPDSAPEQFNQGQPWDVVPGASIDSGHYIVGTGRKATNDNGVLTWGKRQAMTNRFYETYNDESWVIVSEDELKNGVSRRGLDLAHLTAALQSLGLAVPAAG